MIADRIAGAPISWGVCEAPGWGHQLGPARVLDEMRGLGIGATEFGPDGFLPKHPAERAALLDRYDLRAVGGFLPLPLHDPGRDPLPAVDTFVDACLGTGAGVVVLAAATGESGYDTRPVLDDTDWRALLGNLDRISAHARDRGVLVTLHPHVGTMVEDAADVERVIAGSDVALCLDTGHLLVGGTDPVALSIAHADRVGHVHLKDVDAAMAARVRAGDLPYSDAVRDGLFRPLGHGDVDTAAMLTGLEAAGYPGWYVLEQDVMLPEPPGDADPMPDVRTSLEYVRGIVR